MSVPIRIGLFAAGLVAVFGAAFLLGDVTDPDSGEGDTATHADDSHSPELRAPAAGPARIVVDDRRFEPGVSETLAFRVVDRQGLTVEDFDVEHDRRMHVIAVRRDLTGYQHVHPRRTGDGGWEVDVAFAEAGPQRVFADFTSKGDPYTLSGDVEVAGDYEPRPLPAAIESADTGDYAVAVAKAGTIRRFTVSKNGQPVDDIEPYLGARGHLVALREGDLAFQHVHPRDEATEGREISFDVALPKEGRYRLFLQFKHDGDVHMAAFTEDVREGHGEAAHGH